MSVTAHQNGRNLTILVEGVDEPFTIAPLPGFAGEKATQMFLEIAARKRPADQLTEVWMLSVDGVDENDDTIIDGPNWTRIKRTLSLSEAEDVLHPAFYWQTTLGIDAVNEFIEAGGGLAGAKKVLQRFILTLGISPTATSQGSALETLTQLLVSIPPTSTPTGGSTLDKLPPSKRGFMQSRKQRRATGSQARSSGD